MDIDRSCLCQADPAPLRGEDLKKKFMPVGAGSGFRSAAYGGAFRATGVPCLSFAGARAEKKGARNHWREWP